MFDPATGALVATAMEVSVGSTITIDAAQFVSGQFPTSLLIELYDSVYGRKSKKTSKSGSSSGGTTTTIHPMCNAEQCVTLDTSGSLSLFLGDSFGNIEVGSLFTVAVQACDGLVPIF